MWVRKTVSFAGTCAARDVVCLVSQRLMRPFRVRVLHVHFPAGTNNLMVERIFASPDDEEPASGYPTGANLLQDYGQVDYVRGDGLSLELEHMVDVREGGMYLKVHADNADFYPHAVDVQVEIEVEMDVEG